MLKKKVASLSSIFMLSVLASCASTNSNLPAISHDGLELVESSKFNVVYIDPNALFADYTKYALEPCQVSFKKDWLRDQNRSRRSLSGKVTQEDVDKIKVALGEQCDKYFKAAILKEPAYELVDTLNQGEEIMLLRPSIINLDVTAPDIQTPSRSRTYAVSAGEMTLYLEAFDSTTGDILARAVDRKRAVDQLSLQISNRVTNMAEANRILKIWSRQLRAGLDAIASE